MNIELLSLTEPIPDLLDKDRILPLRPANFYDGISANTLHLWCHYYARYCIVTEELVAWLRQRIGSRKAIEIGSGAGDLAHHLRIPATDSRMQEWPEIRRYYTDMGQPVICYPKWVEECDALNAVHRHCPQVVVGAWVTQWIDPYKPPPPGGGSVWGVRERQLVGMGVTYILVGHQRVHGEKQIMSLPHEEYALPFLRSRCEDAALNRIWIWNP